MGNIPPRVKTLRRLALCGAIVVVATVGYCAIGWHVRSSAAETLQQAERNLRQRNNAGVRETLKWLLWFEPTHPRALLIKGVSLNADRRFPEAIAVLQRIPETSDGFADAEIALASSLAHDDQLDRAEAVLRRHLQRIPKSVAAREELVRLNIRLLRQREAVALLLEYGEHGWEDFGALPLLLELQVKPLTPHEIVSSLEDTNRKHPDQPLVVLALARVYSLLGRMEQAQTEFENALRLNPEDSSTNLLAAEFFFNRGDVTVAERLLNSDFMKSVEDDRFFFLLSRLSENSGQVDQALDYLQKALKQRPGEETYVLMQGTLLRRLGRIEESRTAAIRATELAEIRKRLFVLSNEFDRERPSAEQCLEIADALERWAQPEQAGVWRRVSQLLTQARTPQFTQ